MVEGPTPRRPPEVLRVHVETRRVVSPPPSNGYKKGEPWEVRGRRNSVITSYLTGTPSGSHTLCKPRFDGEGGVLFCLTPGTIVTPQIDRRQSGPRLLDTDVRVSTHT